MEGDRSYRGNPLKTRTLFRAYNPIKPCIFHVLGSKGSWPTAYRCPRGFQCFHTS